MLVFKGEGRRRTLVSMEQKMQTFDAIYNKGITQEEAVGALYEGLGRKTPPKNIGMLLSLWKSPIVKAIRNGDEAMIALAKKYNLLEEREEEEEEEETEEETDEQPVNVKRALPKHK